MRETVLTNYGFVTWFDNETRDLIRRLKPEEQNEMSELITSKYDGVEAVTCDGIYFVEGFETDYPAYETYSYVPVKVEKISDKVIHDVEMYIHPEEKTRTTVKLRTESGIKTIRKTFVSFTQALEYISKFNGEDNVIQTVVQPVSA
ncbi:MAG: hypothetical protein II399_08070 [Lachnospiraceae bacterium]|nr:hypothetical protein [Lachnospiraceae bacterium]